MGWCIGPTIFRCSSKWNYKVASGHQWLEKVRQKPVTVMAAAEAALRELRASQGTGKVRLISRRRFGVNERGKHGRSHADRVRSDPARASR
jgi:hypothetical protein